MHVNYLLLYCLLKRNAQTCNEPNNHEIQKSEFFGLLAFNNECKRFKNECFFKRLQMKLPKCLVLTCLNASHIPNPKKDGRGERRRFPRQFTLSHQNPAPQVQVTWVSEAGKYVLKSRILQFVMEDFFSALSCNLNFPIKKAKKSNSERELIQSSLQSMFVDAVSDEQTKVLC